MGDGFSPPNAIERIKTQWLPKVVSLTTLGDSRLLMCGGILGRYITPSDCAATLCRLTGLGHILTSFLSYVVKQVGREQSCYRVCVEMAYTVSASFKRTILQFGQLVTECIDLANIVAAMVRPLRLDWQFAACLM